MNKLLKAKDFMVKAHSYLGLVILALCRPRNLRSDVQQ